MLKTDCTIQSDIIFPINTPFEHYSYPLDRQILDVRRYHYCLPEGLTTVITLLVVVTIWTSSLFNWMGRGASIALGPPSMYILLFCAFQFVFRLVQIFHSNEPKSFSYLRYVRSIYSYLSTDAGSEADIPTCFQSISNNSRLAWRHSFIETDVFVPFNPQYAREAGTGLGYIVNNM